jgi:hypothetical protein
MLNVECRILTVEERPRASEFKSNSDSESRGGQNRPERRLGTSSANTTNTWYFTIFGQEYGTRGELKGYIILECQLSGSTPGPGCNERCLLKTSEETGIIAGLTVA